MSLSRKDVQNVAFLARLKIEEQDLDNYALELSHIMGWIEQLASLNTDNVEPLASVANQKLTLREDKPFTTSLQDAVLSNAPEKTYTFFSVPKVIE